MKAAGLAAIALLACGSAIAQAKGAWQEDFRATPDSRYIQGLLGQPFPQEPKDLGVPIATLRASGNAREAELLERARNRLILARMTGESVALPATVAEAIARESSIPGFQDTVREALRRVTVQRLPSQGAQVEAKGNGTSELEVRVAAHNGLAVALRRLGVRAQPGAESMSCDLDGSGGALAPGETRTVRCRDGGPDERMRTLADSLARDAAKLVVFSAGSVDATLTQETVVFEDRAGARAHESLAAASCEDKGTCAAVEKAREARATEAARQRRPSERVAIGIGIALLLAGVAAWRMRPATDAGRGTSVLAAVVTAFAGFAAAVLVFGQGPNAAAAWLVGFPILYFGAVPFLVALAALIGAVVSGRGTRLGAFGATFGAGIAIVAASVLLEFR